MDLAKSTLSLTFLITFYCQNCKTPGFGQILGLGFLPGRDTRQNTCLAPDLGPGPFYFYGTPK